MPLPDDPDGDALRRLFDEGSDPNQPMAIDFHVAAPSEAAARRIAAAVAARDYRTQVHLDEETQRWTCWCTRTMLAQYAAIVACQAELDVIGRAEDGRADGWGTFGNRDALLAVLADRPRSAEVVDAIDLTRYVRLLGTRWSLADGQLCLALRLDGMADGGAIAAYAAKLADEVDHHPEIRLSYGAFELRISTHDADALTMLDLGFAARLERWLREGGPGSL
jgi:pterin-4a-carbinolamine dehydratase/regulator of RNase E activity RraB